MIFFYQYGSNNIFSNNLLCLQAERIDMEERYSSLQEEAQGKARKMKLVYRLYMTAKGELSDLQSEQQRETEELLESIRLLSRETRLHQLLIDSFIPPDYQVREISRISPSDSDFSDSDFSDSDFSDSDFSDSDFLIFQILIF